MGRNYLFCPICGNVNLRQNSKCINCQTNLLPNPIFDLNNNKDYSKYTFKRRSYHKVVPSTFNDSDGLIYNIEGGNAFRINNVTRFFFLLLVIIPFLLIILSSIIDFAHFQNYSIMILVLSIFSGIFYLFTYLYSLRDYNTVKSASNHSIGQLKNEFSLLKIFFLAKSNKWSFYDHYNKKIFSITIKNTYNGSLITPDEQFIITVDKDKQAMRYYRQIIEITAIGKTTDKAIILYNNPTPKKNKWSLVENPKEFEIFAHTDLDSKLIMFFSTILIKKFFVSPGNYGYSM